MNDEANENKSNLTDLIANPLKWDLVGPTVEDDIRRVINRYGMETVRNAALKLTKPNRGRPKENDWPELRDVIEADARIWLDGGDPLAARSNYSVAKEFADKNPGHSHPATMKRIGRKLAKNNGGRLWFMLVRAEDISRRENRSYTQTIRALEKLSELDTHPVWTRLFHRAKSDVADYEAKFGALPAVKLSMNEVEDSARNSLAKFLPDSVTNSSGELFSRYVRKTPKYS